MEYTSLEPKSLSSIGLKAPSFTGEDNSLSSVSTFLFFLFFIIIFVVAFYRYFVAGILRMQARESAIRKSNDIIKQTTFGLFGVFILFLLLFTINKDMVTGRVGFSGLNNKQSLQKETVVPGMVLTSSSGAPSSCESKEAIINKMSSSGVCAGTVCKSMVGCTYRQYIPLIQKEAASLNIDPKLIIVTMCRESRGNKSAQNKNPDGTFDCGLMQINQEGSCGVAILDPEENIKRGANHIKKTLSLTSRVYPNIPIEAGAFATYNCCSNGTVPNAPSKDCTESAGFPFTLPKWACPINPGEGKFNMCAVKNYACELSACLKEL